MWQDTRRWGARIFPARCGIAPWVGYCNSGLHARRQQESLHARAVAQFGFVANLFGLLNRAEFNQAAFVQQHARCARHARDVAEFSVYTCNLTRLLTLRKDSSE